MTVANASAPVRFRHSGALWVAAIITFMGAMPVALGDPSNKPWLAVILLVPVAFAVWAWRAGVDAGDEGIRIRGVIGSRLLPWAELEGFGVHKRGAFAVLKEGVRVPLPAVGRRDLPRLIAAGGSELVVADRGGDDGTADETGTEGADEN